MLGLGRKNDRRWKEGGGRAGDGGRGPGLREGCRQPAYPRQCPSAYRISHAAQGPLCCRWCALGGRGWGPAPPSLSSPSHPACRTWRVESRVGVVVASACSSPSSAFPPSPAPQHWKAKPAGRDLRSRPSGSSPGRGHPFPLPLIVLCASLLGRLWLGGVDKAQDLQLDGQPLLTGLLCAPG